MNDARRPDTAARSLRKKDDLEELDEALEALRIAYEKYFAGIERLEPGKDRKHVKDLLRRAQGVQTNNTARKFRLQGAQARLVTLEQYWNRLTRQIEEGTFKRDKLRAERLGQEAAAKSGAAVKTAPTGPTTAGAPVVPAARDGHSDALKSLYRDFLRARTEVGEARSVSIEQLAATVAKQSAAVRAQFNCRDVEFKVAVKDGKAILKAVPKM